MSKAMTGYERLKRHREKKKAERAAASSIAPEVGATAPASVAVPGAIVDMKAYIGDFVRSLSPEQRAFLKGWMTANIGGEISLDILKRLALEFIDGEIARADSLRSEVDARKIKTERQKVRNSPVRYDACVIDNRKLDLANMRFPEIPANYSVGYADKVRSIFRPVRDIRQAIKEGAPVAEIESKIKSVADYCAEWIRPDKVEDAVDEYIDAWASLSAYRKRTPAELAEAIAATAPAPTTPPVGTIAAPVPEAPTPTAAPEPVAETVDKIDATLGDLPLPEIIDVPVVEKIDEALVDRDRKITREEVMALMRASRHRDRDGNLVCGGNADADIIAGLAAAEFDLEIDERAVMPIA